MHPMLHTSTAIMYACVKMISGGRYHRVTTCRVIWRSAFLGALTELVPPEPPLPVAVFPEGVVSVGVDSSDGFTIQAATALALQTNG